MYPKERRKKEACKILERIQQKTSQTCKRHKPVDSSGCMNPKQNKPQNYTSGHIIQSKAKAGL